MRSSLRPFERYPGADGKYTPKCGFADLFARRTPLGAAPAGAPEESVHENLFFPKEPLSTQSTISATFDQPG
jgi:hypothetical protein